MPALVRWVFAGFDRPRSGSRAAIQASVSYDGYAATLTSDNAKAAAHLRCV